MKMYHIEFVYKCRCCDKIFINPARKFVVPVLSLRTLTDYAIDQHTFCTAIDQKISDLPSQGVMDLVHYRVVKIEEETE